MLFDSSLRRDLSRSFGATLVVILTIVVTMMLIRTLGQAAVGRIAPQDVVLLLGYFALAHLPTMLALSLFISVVATLGRMYRESEMAIWFASGVGLSRFVRPVLRVSWPVLLVVALLVLFVWPWVNQKSNEMRERFEQRSDLSRVAPGQFQTSRDGQRVFFIERSTDNGRDARNVFILARQGDSESVTSARSGRIENTPEANFLVLDRGQRNEQNLKSNEKTVSSFETYRVQAGEKALSGVDKLPPKAQRSAELVRDTDPAGRGELAWRLGLALGAGNLLLLGIGLSATSPRRASNWNLLFALLAFVVYYNLINLSKAWVSSGKLEMGAALAVIHGGAFLAALALIWWRDHGTHLQLRPRRPTSTVAPA
ncbi:LPS export ABC transporter permease LptF [Piscinibacter sp. HJYY11]|uniref:LPS export ABC transporter permease LptF n=1 Tax=Piscinibacter sp. HJYY11 TaxID=2801333 RepID=UPI00191D450B|nr:LPS export ABC transporter permease LptF [Piscinibacter sp. HJYY11]MBL0726710.1 LPS export ABC transporter permease LptF [Piscinibacter sp. HJYY11]